MHDDNRRYHRVFMHLHSLCETDEARDSLRQFQEMWEAKRLRECGGGVGMGYGAGYGANHGAGNAKGGAGNGKVKEKKGVFEKLGLRRKSGL